MEDENDLLSTHKFISTPKVEDTPAELNEEYKNFYRSSVVSVGSSGRGVSFEEINDPNSVLNNFAQPSSNSIRSSRPLSNLSRHSNISNVSDAKDIIQRYKKEVKTYVSVDSRDRDKLLFPKPSHFKIFLGKTFYNVKTIRLASIEFPNTNAVINSTNNRIAWRNYEDIEDDIIDTVTKTYPVYSVELRIGSYISTTLQNEIASKLASLKRKNKVGDFHYFTVELDVDTDIVTITSLVLTQLPNNPLSVTTGLGLITVNAPNHGYASGERVYISGVKNLAGLTSSVLGGFHEVTVINANTFQYEVNVKAGETAIGGGNTVKSGRSAPFQLLFGEYSNTVAPNIGFPLENSAQRIDTFVKSIENLYQVQIVTVQPHGLTRSPSIINTVLAINGSTTSPNIDGNRVITNIVDTNTILVSVNAPLNFNVFSNGQVIYNGGTPLDILSISNYETNTVLLTTFSPHNYSLTDVGDTVTLYDTLTVPSFNGDNTIFGTLSDTTLILPGSVLDGGSSNVSVVGTGGSMPRHQPLTTKTLNIVNIIPGVITTIVCHTAHTLKIGDKIKINNILTLPSVVDKNSGIFEVYSIPSSTSFTINFKTTSFDPVNIDNGTAFIGTRIITVSFPYHGFNTIVSITNSGAGVVQIITQLPHNLTTGNKIRISSSNCIPSIDDGGYEVTVVSSDTFTIQYVPALSAPGTFGILGMSNNFYLYGSTELGGLSVVDLTSTLHSVREILDKHTFTFNADNYASSTAKGGGSNVYISSYKHGFSGTQTNTKNSLLNRSINLEGENYAFLCCPQLATMMNTGSVKDIFARITLDQSPGSMVFTFLSNPKEFETVPLDKLSELEFSVLNWNNTQFDFNDLDYSFVLEITEVVDTTTGFNISSRRGVGSNE